MKNQQVQLDIQIRSLEEEKRSLKSKSEIMSKNDIFMSKETQYLQEQLQINEENIEQLLSEQKAEKGILEHLQHQEQLALAKIAEVKDQNKKYEAQLQQQLLSMSNMNREAMTEISNLKLFVEAEQLPDGQPGIIKKIDQNSEDLLNKMNEMEY